MLEIKCLPLEHRIYRFLSLEFKKKKNPKALIIKWEKDSPFICLLWIYIIKRSCTKIQAFYKRWKSARGNLLIGIPCSEILMNTCYALLKTFQQLRIISFANIQNNSAISCFYLNWTCWSLAWLESQLTNSCQFLQRTWLAMI